MENNICNSMILTSRRRHFYLVGQSKHKVGACGVNNQASAVLAGESTKLPFVFEAVREIYRSIFGVASFKKVDRFRSEIQLAGHPVRGLKYEEANEVILWDDKKKKNSLGGVDITFKQLKETH
ncbi:hypothetical protein TNCV_4504091 [Trichonephila clavipes]|nr:hypothetical protein TNCV_4504091 [Trichonephila clavipes]